MSFDTLFYIITRLIDLTLGLIGLFLVARVVLHLFNMPSTYLLMRVVAWPTDPLLHWLNQKLNLHTYTYRISTRVDINLISSLTALVLLWGAHTAIEWLMNIFLTIARAFSNGPCGWFRLLMLVIQILFSAYELILLLRVIFDWLHIPQTNSIIRWMYTITDPLLAQIRRLMPVSFAGFDFSPVVAMILLRLLRGITLSTIGWIFGSQCNMGFY